MNKIEVVDDIVTSINIDNSIEYEFIPCNEFFDVNDIKLKILKDTDLEINYTGTKKHKIDLFITVCDNANLNLVEYRTGSKCKIQYKMYINDHAKVNINKFYDVDEIKEMMIVSLNGIESSIDYNFKTISNDKEKYDTIIYHNEKNTYSNITNNGVNINNGKLTFNISTFVPNGKTECIANQSSRIINLTDNKCQINPNLFIDEYDVEANHSAHIGKFNNEELFYLMSRGITKEDSINLLIKGFLLNDNLLNENIEKSIQKYWR